MLDNQFIKNIFKFLEIFLGIIGIVAILFLGVQYCTNKNFSLLGNEGEEIVPKQRNDGAEIIPNIKELSSYDKIFCEDFFIYTQTNHRDVWGGDHFTRQDISTILGSMRNQGYNEPLKERERIKDLYEKTYRQYDRWWGGYNTKEVMKHYNIDTSSEKLEKAFRNLFLTDKVIVQPNLKYTYQEEFEENEIWIVEDIKTGKRARLVKDKNEGDYIQIINYSNERLEKATIYPEQRHETYTEANISKYEGKIGTYPITLFIKTGNTKNGDEVGHYYYNKSPLSTFILKQMTFDAINASGTMRLVLKEYTQDGYHSGTFDGFFEMRGGSYHGTFTNSKGKKYKFELIKQVDY